MLEIGACRSQVGTFKFIAENISLADGITTEAMDLVSDRQNLSIDEILDVH